MFSLQEIIDQFGRDSEALSVALSQFSCKRNHDLESFLKERAVTFEKLSKSRTYVYLNDEDDGPFILGFFSLAIKTFEIPDGVSNRGRMELDGFAAKIKGHPIADIPCYLVGQLGRNDFVSHDILPGAEILEDALSVIARAQEAVGGRYVLIECVCNKDLVQFYVDNHFTEVSNVFDGDISMAQLLRKIS